MKKRKQLHKLGGILLAFGLLLSVATPVKAAVTQEDLANPVMDKSTHYGSDITFPYKDRFDYAHYTEYQYVYFGSYPQREITGEELTDDIINAKYDENSDAVVNGKKYRRAIYEMGERYGTINDQGRGCWDPYATDGYRYFLYEPIKWRILNNDGNKLFLMSSTLVDYRLVEDYTNAGTWEDCSLREWLNSENALSEDAADISKGVPGFYKVAFHDKEKAQILVTDVVQDVNPYSREKNGADTKDKVFLLSFEELTNEKYGFCKQLSYLERDYECGNGWDVTASEYANAMSNMPPDYYSSRAYRLRTAGKSDMNGAYPKTAKVGAGDSSATLSLVGSRYDMIGSGVVPAINVSYNLSDCIRVTFETNGAGSIEEQILLGSGCAQEPVALTENRTQIKQILQRQGYVFKGWYMDAACTKAFDFKQVLKEDTTIYAGWKKLQDQPVGLSGGILKIQGTTSAMEYATSTGESAVWTTCKDGETEVPAAGTWYVRYKGSDTLVESEAVTVTVITVDQVIADHVKEQGIPESMVAITDAVIENTMSENDIPGSSFASIQARADKTWNYKIRLKWNKVSGADGYEIYSAKCGKSKYQKVKTITKNATTTYTHKKLNGKKLKKGTYYKYIVKAYKMVEGQKITVAASKTIHVTTKGGKYGNAKSVKLKTDKKLKKKKGTYTVTIKTKKTYTLKASEVKESKKIKKHRPIAYETSDQTIATVNKKGKITGKKKGTCYLYAYAQNGMFVKIKVIVK